MLVEDKKGYGHVRVGSKIVDKKLPLRIGGSSITNGGGYKYDAINDK